MASFSSMACCSALSSCSKEDILSAYARMVAFLVQKKKYHKCEAEELTIDFEKMYGFTIPFHPMRTIMDQCTQLGYLTYNSSLHVFFQIMNELIAMTSRVSSKLRITNTRHF